MKKSDISQMPEYFDRYINLVGDIELLDAFDDSLAQLENLDFNLLEHLNGAVYAPGKWTVKTLIQHVTDFERILCYRALLFARGDANIRQGIDETLLAETAKADRRTIESVIAELKSVRLASRSLFANFDDEMLRRMGKNWKYEISVLAMGFSIVGHQIHHLAIIRDKYYPLAD
jgi:hypothetical protein